MTREPARAVAPAPQSAQRMPRLRQVPWWASVLLVYGAARIVTTVMMLVLASVQGPNPWTASHPGYFEFANIWDGRWYEIVAGSAYPDTLPRDAAGGVTENAWAFMPVYPRIVSAVMLVGLPWNVSAVLVSLAFGAGACLLFYRLLLPRLGASSSLFAVVLLASGPVSPLFQVAYAEALQVFLIVLALLLLARRRFAWLVPVVVILSFTRPGGLAFALAMVIYAAVRWWRRRVDPFPVRERVASIAVAIVAGLAGLAWPAIAAAVTGSVSAYTDTELAWRAAYIGRQPFVPFAGWFQGGNWWLGFPIGTIVVLALAVSFALVMASRPVLRLGVESWAWSAAYACYLFAVFFPQSSTFRLLLPLFPLLGALALPRSRLYRVALVVLFVAGQWAWLLACWGVDGLDWTPP